MAACCAKLCGCSLGNDLMIFIALLYFSTYLWSANCAAGLMRKGWLVGKVKSMMFGLGGGHQLASYMFVHVGRVSAFPHFVASIGAANAA